MPCEYLPLEIDLGEEGRTKGQVKRSKPVKRCEPGPEEEEEEDEGYPYYGYPPATQPQNSGQESVEFRDENVPEVQFQQPEEGNRGLVNEDLSFIWAGESEKEREEISQQAEKDHGKEVQMEEEEIPQQEVDVLEEEQPGGRSDGMEDAYVTPCENNRWPQRERRPPKTFTYDWLGTPACYNVGHTNTLAFQSMPYGMQNLTP